MEYHKAFAREDGKVQIRCPVCMAVKEIPNSRLPSKHRFPVRCRCGTIFKIQIESRKSFRKDVDLDCRVILPEQNHRWGNTLNESHETKITPINCRITNIPLGGIRLKIDGQIRLHEDDQIIAKFNLDNSASTELVKQAIVKKIHGNDVSCKFLEHEHNDKNLRFYFL
jgi:hypothetical protein